MFTCTGKIFDHTDRLSRFFRTRVRTRFFSLFYLPKAAFPTSTAPPITAGATRGTTMHTATAVTVASEMQVPIFGLANTMEEQARETLKRTYFLCLAVLIGPLTRNGLPQ